MKKNIQIILGIVITIISLYFAFKGIDYKETIEIIKNVDVLKVAFAFIIGTAFIVVRALRWECFIPTDRPIRKWVIISAAYIGYMASNVLPAKLGEVVRAYVLGEKEDLKKSAIFASVVSERLFDCLTGVVILSISLIFIENLPSTVSKAALILLAFTVVGIIILVVLSKNKIMAHKIFHKVFSILPQNIANKLIDFSCNFIDGIGMKTSPLYIFLLFFYTILYLAGQVFAINLLLSAFSIKSSLIIGLFMFAVSGFGFAVPSAPSGIGPFEWAIIFGLSLVGVDKALAAPYALVYHLLGIVPVSIVGAICLFSLGINLKAATKSDK